jgi:CIC family chloride channel protein
VQTLLIESDEAMVVITDREGGQPLAVVTLHDLLRAQLAMAGRETSG